MRFKYIRIISLLLAVLILFTGCNAIFDTSGDKGQFTIRAFKLDAKDKSGDSLLLKSPDGKTMLIDAGLPECSSQLVGYLKKLNIGKLDYVVATHRHVDHIGGMPTVLDTFKADTVYTTDMPYNTEINKKFNEAITRNGCKNVYLKRGDTFDFGSDIKVEVLNPEPDIVIPKNFVPEDNAYFLNDRSIVLKMTYGQKTFLFCGDLYKSREVELVNLYGDKLNADFLKVPHHGAATS
ncbi:MAG: MBL fold metallo-hydrolase, partial [Bacillota bacterium]|nr:MBL fold metallo-hydrolase [Bacillota bacterium]